jgi:DNA polymerase III sliding clamp (beta) subunit (PCNA family)
VPPGARLILRDIPRSLQREFGVGEMEAVTFTEISADVNTYRDALRFKNNRQVLLQALYDGQRVAVFSLVPAEADEKLVLAAQVMR